MIVGSAFVCSVISAVKDLGQKVRAGEDTIAGTRVACAAEVRGVLERRERRSPLRWECLGLVGDELAQERNQHDEHDTDREAARRQVLRKSFAYPALVAIAVVPVGLGIMSEKSPANSDARPVQSIQLPIITP